VTPYFTDAWLSIFEGDCREVMATMEPESVHCVVTSPPYWGLRDYGTATWAGGDAGCDHKGAPLASSSSSSLAGYSSEHVKVRTNTMPMGATCRKCGATRIDAQLGLEQTPEEYVAVMVAVFREVRRVLRADGTLWLNLGDSYATGAGAVGDRPGGGAQGDVWSGAGPRGTRGGSSKQPHTGAAIGPMTQPNRMPLPGLKPKDLVGIPWRVAFALQADGWYLRSDIIWAKPNPMPESVTDRPTKSHEYLFLLSKSARYFWDADAVREPSTGTPGVGKMSFRADIGAGGVWRDEERTGDVSQRNIRSVWTIATAPYPGAHFATFPQKLVEPCIKAGCPEGGTVLDPFAGTGTVGLVAQRLSRRAVLIDLNADYLRQCLIRNAQKPLGLEAG
jgi:DNA modification methylase